MKRRDLISAVMGLPAMAGIKAMPLVPGEAVDAEVPQAGATKGAGTPFVIVLQPDRALPKEAIVRLREQMTEFLDSAGVNAKAVVLPNGMTIKTVTPDGVVHGGEPEAPPDTKPWCGQLVYAWASVPTNNRRSFDVVELPHGHRLCLRTECGGEKYDTTADVSITVNNEVCPHEAMWLINQHEKNFTIKRQAAAMERIMKPASPKREST
jgi:hypothetical protein